MVLTSEYLHEFFFFYMKGLRPSGSPRVALQWCWPVQTNIYSGGDIYELTRTKSWTRLIYMHGMCASVTEPKSSFTNYNDADLYKLTSTMVVISMN